MDNILDYIKFVIKSSHDKTKILTTLERNIYEIYKNNTYECFMENNTNFIVDIEKIKNDTYELIKNKTIVKLLFSDNNIIYVEKGILAKTGFFTNMFNDIPNINMIMEIPMVNELNNYNYILILVEYLNSKYIDENLFEKDLELLCDILKILDYVDYFDIFKFIDIFVFNNMSYTNVTLDMLEYIHNATEIKQYNPTTYSRYSLADAFQNIFSNNETQLRENNTIDTIMTSSFFQAHILHYDSGTYVIKYNYYNYFDKICCNTNYHFLLTKLIQNKPDNYWKIIDNIYYKMAHKRFHINIFLNVNKDNIDESFFDCDINNYDFDLVLFLIDKYKYYDSLNTYKTKNENHLQKICEYKKINIIK